MRVHKSNILRFEHHIIFVSWNASSIFKNLDHFHVDNHHEVCIIDLAAITNITPRGVKQSNNLEVPHKLDKGWSL